MPKTLKCVLSCYGALLRLYPAKLRDAYGADMTNVFEQALRTEFKKRGGRGVAATGCRAFGELFTVAIPGHLSGEWIISASLSLAINSGVLAWLVWLMLRRPPGSLH